MVLHYMYMYPQGCKYVKIQLKNDCVILGAGTVRFSGLQIIIYSILLLWKLCETQMKATARHSVSQLFFSAVSMHDIFPP